MSDFNAKMHPIRFPLGLCPRRVAGAYSAPPAPLAVFKGPTSKGREEEGRGKEGEGKGGEVDVDGGIWPTHKFWRDAPYDGVCEPKKFSRG